MGLIGDDWLWLSVVSLDRFGLSVVDDVIRFDGNDGFRCVGMDRPWCVVVVVFVVIVVVVVIVAVDGLRGKGREWPRSVGMDRPRGVVVIVVIVVVSVVVVVQEEYVAEGIDWA